MTKFEELHAAGQSVWIDYIRRGLITSGELADLVAEGVRGLTSNPTIFEKAIAGSDEYDAQIAGILSADPDTPTAAIFEALAVEDIRAGADLLGPVHEESGGADGHISLEVSPHLAHDSEGTIAEAHRLWVLVDRPNLLIKVPATPQGIPAIESLTAAGISVNATLMFSLADYEAVSHAYLRGLRRAASPERIASVASFFVSRVDTKADSVLEKVGSPEALDLLGTIAVANAKLAYHRFQEVFSPKEFGDLAARGAHRQRVLWASTSTKNPAYKDTIYVDDLVGPYTVNTLPPATLDAVRDHGVVDPAAVTAGVEEAMARVARLADLGIDFDAITAELQVEGVAAFAGSYDDLLASIGRKRENLRLA
jgi:transaldolase/transaldolase/glucose-6-phosphate isomerase